MQKIITPYHTVIIPDDAAYCATPSRLVKHVPSVIRRARQIHRNVFHPFLAFPHSMYEGNPEVGRDRTIQICIEAVEKCKYFLMFGISEGTLIEARRALELGREIEIHFNDWIPGDREWRHYYTKLARKHKFPLRYLVEF